MLAIHRTVIDHAALPLSSWLPHVDTAASVQVLLRHLSEVAVLDGTHREQSPPLNVAYLTSCNSTNYKAVCARGVRRDPELYRNGIEKPPLQLYVHGFTRCDVAGWVDVEGLTKTLSIPNVHAKVWCKGPLNVFHEIAAFPYLHSSLCIPAHILKLIVPADELPFLCRSS